jgi:hypothetical protein
MDGDGHSDEVLDQNEQQHFGNWRKGCPCYQEAENVTELCSSPRTLQKAEFKNGE